MQLFAKLYLLLDEICKESFWENVGKSTIKRVHVYTLFVLLDIL